MNLVAARHRALLGVLVCASGVASSLARALPAGAGEPMPPPALDQLDEDHEDDAGASPAKSGFVLDRNPTWAVGLDGYAGIAAQFADASRSHALAGGLVRLRWRYIQVGGSYERTDYVKEEWHLLGVHAGAFVPFTRWVDFEFAVGGASRRYASSDVRYGPSGYSYAVPALTLRAGVSDRSSERLFGARLGVHLVAAVDVESPAASYQYRISETSIVSGTTNLGGTSVALVMSLGLDVGGPPEKH